MPRRLVRRSHRLVRWDVRHYHVTITIAIETIARGKMVMASSAQRGAYSSFIITAKSVALSPISTQFCLLAAASPGWGKWKMCWPVQSRSWDGWGVSMGRAGIGRCEGCMGRGGLLGRCEGFVVLGRRWGLLWMGVLLVTIPSRSRQRPSAQLRRWWDGTTIAKGGF